ncbi:DUF938 domain-containing protein [Rhizobium giardinii]|uniref:DUF938 domain-containing protein n=1 Tax=Rhizobium giardinii TaxID=56731 RepID=UPI003D6F831F
MGFFFSTAHSWRDGAHNAHSNAAFDAALKERNPSWGVRDIADLEQVGEAAGLNLRETIESCWSSPAVVPERQAGANRRGPSSIRALCWRSRSTRGTCGI